MRNGDRPGVEEENVQMKRRISLKCHEAGVFASFGLILFISLITPGWVFGQGTWTSYTNANDIHDIVLDGSYIWAAASGGVVRWNIHDGSYVKYTNTDGLASCIVRSIAIDSSGYVWGGTSYDGVSIFDGASWDTYVIDENCLSCNDLHVIAVDAYDNKWIGTGYHVVKFDGTTWTKYTTRDGLGKGPHRSVVFDSSGNVWVGCDDGEVSKFDGQSWTTFRAPVTSTVDEVYGLAFDHLGNLWISTHYSGIFRFDGAEWINYREENGLPTNSVLTIAVDSKGIIWCGYNYRKGAGYFDGETWRTVETGSSVKAILFDLQNNVWFGSALWYWYGTSRGLIKFDGEHLTSYTTHDGPADNRIYAILLDAFHNKWFLSKDGSVSKFDGHTWTFYDSKEEAIENDYSEIVTMFPMDFSQQNRVNYYNSFLWIVDNALSVWITCSAGVKKYNGSVWTTYTTADGLKDDYVLTIARGDDGNLWFSYGCRDLGVTRYDGETWQTYTTEDGLVSNAVSGVATDSKGDLWFGTGCSMFDGGVSTFDGAICKNFPVGTEGLLGNTYYRIAVSDSDNVWVSCDSTWQVPMGSATAHKGVSLFDGSSWTTFTRRDGLGCKNAQAIAIDCFDNTWVGGDGVSVYDTENWRTYEQSAYGLIGQPNVIAIEPSGIVWIGTNIGISKFEPEMTCPKGDVDGNGRMDLIDVMLAVNIILEFVDPVPYHTWAADLNSDGIINVLDVMEIVLAILG
jgi:ligand-binding sensor domain-containing protein